MLQPPAPPTPCPKASWLGNKCVARKMMNYSLVNAIINPSFSETNQSEWEAQVSQRLG